MTKNTPLTDAPQDEKTIEQWMDDFAGRDVIVHPIGGLPLAAITALENLGLIHTRGLPLADVIELEKSGDIYRPPPPDWDFVVRRTVK